MKILIVLTSHDRLGDTGKKTGFWFEELAAPFYAFKNSGVELTLASPAGGQPPLDPKSNEPAFQTDDTRRFEQDEEARKMLSRTLKLSTLKEADYDAVFYPGGHGPLWDLVSNEDSIRLIQDFWRSGKPVSAVCHAPIVFANVKDDGGEYIVKNKEVSGFTNSEEDLVELTKIVPVLVEDLLKERGAKFSRAADFEPYCVQDGLLITGQNPASSEGVAKKVLAALG